MTGYAPDVFEYDDEEDYGVQGERVLLDQDHQEKGTVRTIGTKAMNAIPTTVLAGLQDDEDALIQHFLDSNKKQVACQFFASGFCRYGADCEYLHAGVGGKDADEEAYIKEYDEECQVCLEMVLANGK